MVVAGTTSTSWKKIGDIYKPEAFATGSCQIGTIFTPHLSQTKYL